jgi:hypothetical protein
MKSRPVTSLISMLIRALPLTVVACGAAPDEPYGNDESVASTSEAASTDLLLFNTWDSPGVVDVCIYTTDATGWTSSHESRADQAMYALWDTWGSVTGLNFSRLASCTPPGPVAALKMLLTVTDGPANTAGGNCDPGRGTTCSFTAPMAQPVLEFMGGVAHEVGHALRMMRHEHQRGVMSGGTLVHEVPLCPRAQAILDANPGHGDLIPLPLHPITAYDRCSIINYCGLDWGCVNYTHRTPENFAAGFVLTPLDALGAEIVYPTGDTLPLGCSKGCFLTGNGVLVRTTGEIRDSWTARGANPWAQSIYWNGSTPGHTYLPGGQSSNVEFRALSKYHNNGQQIIGGGYVRSSNSKWSALALSIL